MIKYMGKLKSFKELLNMADDIDDDGDLVFNGKEDVQIYFPKNLKDSCSFWIEIKKAIGACSAYFPFQHCASETGLRREWFSELKETEEDKIWKPKQYEGLYFIGVFGNVKHTNNGGNVKHDFNKWKTQEEAAKVGDVIKLYMAMKRWSFDNDGGYVFAEKGLNVCIYYSENEKKYKTTDFYDTNSPTVVYFSNKEKAEKCLEWLKEEGLIC